MSREFEAMMDDWANCEEGQEESFAKKWPACEHYLPIRNGREEPKPAPENASGDATPPPVAPDRSHDPAMAAEDLDAQCVQPEAAAAVPPRGREQQPSCPQAGTQQEQNPPADAGDGGGFPEWMIQDLKKSGLEAAEAQKLGFRPLTPAQMEAAALEDSGMYDHAYAIPFMDPASGLPVLDAAGRPVEAYRLVRTGSSIDGRSNRCQWRRGQAAPPLIPREAHQSAMSGDEVWFTTGAVECLGATLLGLPCIGLADWWGWKDADRNALAPGLERYAVKGKTWVLIWSSGAARQTDCVKAGISAARLLLSRGCRMRVHYLPHDASSPLRDVGLGGHLVGYVGDPPSPDEIQRISRVTGHTPEQLAEERADVWRQTLNSARSKARELPETIAEELPPVTCEDDILAGVVPPLRASQYLLFTPDRDFLKGDIMPWLASVLETLGMRIAILPRQSQRLVRNEMLELLLRYQLRSPARVLDDNIIAGRRRVRELLRDTASLHDRGESSYRTAEADPAGVQLLADIRTLLAGRDGDRTATVDLLGRLAELKGRPWQSGGPLTPRRLASLLRPLGVSPRDAKLHGRTIKCYFLIEFAEAFRKHLPAENAVPDTVSPPGP